jgi:hypothetical protein
LRHKFIIGYTDSETVKLDFDNTPFKEVKYWTLRALKWFKLKGFLILKSSENSYHVVFDRPVTWSENMKVMAWVSLISKKKSLKKWLIMQCIEEGSTLRISPKGEKVHPRIVFHSGDQDKQISDFLKHRKLIQKFLEMIDKTQTHK